MAIRIDASGDSYSRTTNVPAVSLYTAMGWFNITTDRNDFSQFIVNGHATADQIVQVGASSDGTTLEGYISGAGGTTGSALTVGTWYHVAVTRAGAGTAALVYLNGVLNITTGTSSNAVNGKIWFGNSAFTEWINGRMAAIKVWDAVLTVGEIYNEMLSFMPLRTTNLNAWYPMADPAVANNLIDYSGNGNNLTAGGTLTVEEGPPIAWMQTRTRRAYASAVAAPAGSIEYWDGSVLVPYRQPPISGPQFTHRYG